MRTILVFSETNPFAHILADAVGPSLLLVGSAICAAESESKLAIGLSIGITAFVMGFFYEQPFVLTPHSRLMERYTPFLLVRAPQFRSFMQVMDSILDLLFCSSRIFASALMFISVFPEQSHVIACVLLSFVGCALCSQYGYSVLMSNVITIASVIFLSVHSGIYFANHDVEVSCNFAPTQLHIWFLMSTVVFYMQGTATEMSSIYSNLAKWACLALFSTIVAMGYSLPCTLCHRFDNSVFQQSMMVFIGITSIASFNLYFQLIITLVRKQFKHLLHDKYLQDFVHLIYFWGISLSLLAVMFFTFDPQDTFNSAMWVVLIVSKIKFLHLICKAMLA